MLFHINTYIHIDSHSIFLQPDSIFAINNQQLHKNLLIFSICFHIRVHCATVPLRAFLCRTDGESTRNLYHFKTNKTYIFRP